MLTPRANPSTASINGTAYAIGGTSTSGITATVESYSPSKETVSGTVRTQDGAPVPNATVKVLQTNRTTLESLGYTSPQELRDKVENIRQRVSDWNTSHFENFVSDVGERSNFLQSEAFQSSDASRYVAVHTREDWGYDGTVELGEPMASAPANEQIVLSVWDPGDEGWYEGVVDKQLPGATVDDDITIRQLSPGGDVVQSQTYETEQFAESVFPIPGIGGNNHQAAEVVLSEGYYLVQPESGGLAYTIRVGDPVSSWAPDLEDEAGQLVERADYIQGLLNDSVLEVSSVTSNSTGHFSLNAAPDVQSTNLIAYRAPESIRTALDTDPQNLTMADMRSYFESNKEEIINGTVEIPSVHLSAGMVTAEPGQSVEVPVKEAGAPEWLDPTITQELWDQLQEYLDENDYAAAMDFIASNLDELPTEEARERFMQIYDMIGDNQVLSDRAETLANETQGIDTSIEEIRDSLNTTDGETIKDAIESMQQALQEQGSSITTSGDGLSIANGTLSGSRTFAADLDPEDVALVINYADGSSDSLTPESEYMSLDSGTIPGFGGTTVTIDEYPIPDDVAGLAVDWRAVTEDGVGRATDRATNPSFGGDIPGLRSIDLSTMAPGPDELVLMDLHPDKRSTFGDVQAVNVYAPDGSTIQSSLVDGDTAEFTTDGTGAHTIEVVYQNAGGRNFTTNFDIVSQSTDRTMPAGIRVREAAIGTYAITGDGLEGGEVEISNGGATVSLSGIVESSETIPGELHVYAHGISMAPETTTNIALVQGPEERSISRSYRTVWHGPGIGLNALPWRIADGEEYALPADDGAIGWINRTSTSATVHTVSGSDGRVGIRTISNPGLLDEISHWRDLQIDQRIPDFGSILGSTLPWFVVIVPAWRHRRKTAARGS